MTQHGREGCHGFSFPQCGAPQPAPIRQAAAALALRNVPSILLGMRPSLILVALLAAAPLAAQSQFALFTGRFPFTGADAANERAGGAINRFEEFDVNYVLPLAGAPARPLLPATTLQTYLGDGNADGNFLKFRNWKTYFQAINLGGIFVKASDRAAVTWDKVFFTVRRNATATGTAATTEPGAAGCGAAAGRGVARGCSDAAVRARRPPAT